MKSKLLLVGLVTVILLALTACTSTTKEISKEISVDESSSGKQVEIAVDGTLTITLESNVTTGYSWELEQIGDTTILQKIDNKYEAPTSSLIGAGGNEVWSFKALNTGKTTLSMAYSRPWGNGEKGARTFTLTVVVK